METLTRGAVLLSEALEGTTQGAVARLLGVKQQSLSNWKRGKSIPRGQTVALLAQHLGIPHDAWSQVAPVNRPRKRVARTVLKRAVPSEKARAAG